MTPLQITAHLDGPVMGAESIAIDALLAYQVAMQLNLPPITTLSREAAQQSDAQIRSVLRMILMEEPGGRFHLSSGGQCRYEDGSYEKRFLNRRFPSQEAARFGQAKQRNINIAAGVQKTYRIPKQQGHLVGDRIDWYALGEGEKMLALLVDVTHLGKHRSVGSGKVRVWSFDPCEPWDGFPVLRDGKPLRPLPIDWPGLVDWQEEYANLTFPYWDKTRERLCAVTL